jgi:hypothetical protein
VHKILTLRALVVQFSLMRKEGTGVPRVGGVPTLHTHTVKVARIVNNETVPRL